jgi:hypothetical protein
VRCTGRNVERLTALGEIRGQQARINDGVANMFAPDATPDSRAVARQNIGRALIGMDGLMGQYEALVRRTPAEANFAELMRVWRVYHNGVSGYLVVAAYPKRDDTAIVVATPNQPPCAAPGWAYMRRSTLTTLPRTRASSAGMTSYAGLRGTSSTWPSRVRR